MNKVGIAISVFVLLLSCSKGEKAERKLSGKWNIIQFQVTNGSGLSYYYDASGFIEMGEFVDDSSELVVDLSYVKNNDTLYKKFSGNWIQKNDGEYFDILRKTLSVIEKIEKGRILLITKTDLKTIYTDKDTTYTLIFER